jgi:hypothetical protein
MGWCGKRHGLSAAALPQHGNGFLLTVSGEIALEAMLPYQADPGPCRSTFNIGLTLPQTFLQGYRDVLYARVARVFQAGGITVLLVPKGGAAEYCQQASGFDT